MFLSIPKTEAVTVPTECGPPEALVVNPSQARPVKCEFRFSELFKVQIGLIWLSFLNASLKIECKNSPSSPKRPSLHFQNLEKMSKNKNA